jgi:hypothetical protein
MKPSEEHQQFDEAMDTILRADPKAVREAMVAEKRANTEARKAKKTPSALGRASNDKY